MPTEPTEIVSWFIALERLFKQPEVPVELSSELLRPYLKELSPTIHWLKGLVSCW